MATIGQRAGRFVPERDAGVAAFEDAIEMIEELWCRLWCWREFNLPVLALAWVFVSGHRVLALAAGCSLICAVVLLRPLRPEILANVTSRCRARSIAVGRQTSWPRTCRNLGWERRLDKSGWLVPDLVSWSEDAQRVTVLLRPLPEQGARSWDQMADVLRRMVAGATVQWRESHGVLTVVVSRVELPANLAWASGRSEDGRIVIGERHGGAELALDVLRTPHVLLAGASGSGKGGAIRSALAGALEAGWHAFVIDPKESGEYHWLERLSVPVLATLREQVDTLEAIERVREQRQTAIKAAGTDTWHQLPAYVRPGWRPVLVVIDEAADLLVAVKGRSDTQRELNGLQQEAANLIAQLARKGRSAGIHMILAIQRPDTAQLGDQGGALRNNLTARLALGNLDIEGLRMLGVASSDPVATTLDGTPGRGVCVGFGDDPRPSACQVAWLDQHQARAQVTPLAQQGLDAVEPKANGTRLPAGSG